MCFIASMGEIAPFFRKTKANSQNSSLFCSQLFLQIPQPSGRGALNYSACSSPLWRTEPGGHFNHWIGFESVIIKPSPRGKALLLLRLENKIKSRQRGRSDQRGEGLVSTQPVLGGDSAFGKGFHCVIL